MLGRTSLFLSVLAASAPPAQAQVAHEYREICSPLYQFRGSPLEWGFAQFCVPVGDLDQDGSPELLVSARESHVGGRYAGSLSVFSLATGSQLYAIQGSPRTNLGFAIGAGGDVDADGVPDFVASDGYGEVIAYSGASGSELRRWTLPSRAFSVTIAGDVDGDGFDDVLAGSHFEQQQRGAARVLSGRDGSLLQQFAGSTPGQQVGISVLGLGDRDSDGFDDFAIAESRGGPAGTGAVQVYAGASGQVDCTLLPVAPFPQYFGSVLERTADLDGDGVRDLLVLDWGAYFGNYGSAHLYSGATCALIDTVDGVPKTSQVHGAAGDIGDVDGDGLGDIALFVRTLAGTRNETVEIRSGRDRSLLRRFHGPGNYESFVDLAGVSDLDGDGKPELAIASNLYRSVLVVSAATPSSVDLCPGGVNSRDLQATLRTRNSLSIARNELRVRIRNASRSELAQVFYGPGRDQVPFGQGALCVASPRFRLGPPSTLSPAGVLDLAVDFTSPPLVSGAGAIRPGSTWALQAWYRDGASVNTTGAVSITFCP